MTDTIFPVTALLLWRPCRHTAPNMGVHAGTARVVTCMCTAAGKSGRDVDRKLCCETTTLLPPLINSSQSCWSTSSVCLSADSRHLAATVQLTSAVLDIPFQSSLHLIGSSPLFISSTHICIRSCYNVMYWCTVTVFLVFL